MLLYLTTLLVWAHFIVLRASKKTREFTSEVCSWTRFQCAKFFCFKVQVCCECPFTFITIRHFRFLLFPFHKIKFSYNKLFLSEVLWITSISDNIHTHYINKSLEIWYSIIFLRGGELNKTVCFHRHNIGCGQITWCGSVSILKMYFLLTTTIWIKVQFVESFNHNSPFSYKAAIEMLWMPHFLWCTEFWQKLCIIFTLTIMNFNLKFGD